MSSARPKTDHETSIGHHLLTEWQRLHFVWQEPFTEQEAMSNTTLVFQGAIIHSRHLDTLEVLPHATIIVNGAGKIVGLFKSPEEVDQTSIPANSQFHRIPPSDFLIPGFVDTHNHAPQWPMRGQGQGLHILDWLHQVTFPHEARFADPAYARKAYGSCVNGFLRQGITTASYYASSHADATRILADVCLEKGQRALVGKCNMDCNAPDSVRDVSAAISLDETVACMKYIQAMDQDGKGLIQPVLTPRFALCCSPDLLQGLGDIAKSYDGDIAIQTHFNEADQEIQATRELFPQFRSECDLYESFGLLGPRSILAHCTIMTDYEKARLKALNCGIAHCPIANMTVGGGFMAAPVADFLRLGIKVGLGTDSGGGFSSSMLDSIRQSIIASNYREMASSGEAALSLQRAFHLATLGGAEVLSLQDRIGNLAVGKDFDAIMVSSEPLSTMTAREDNESIETTFEKFLMTGDDRNIVQVYVQGRKVK